MAAGMEEESDVGIGVVYEQFMLSRLLLRIIRKHRIRSVLEAPAFGMAGITGINAMGLAEAKVKVTVADSDAVRLSSAKKAWAAAGKKASFCHVQDFSSLPFKDSEFGLSFNFAALWHLEPDGPRLLLREMARVSEKAILVCMPNPHNPMFQIRRAAGRLPPNRKWADLRHIRSELRGCGLRIAEEGLIDIPPWPDIVIPLKDVLARVGVRKGAAWRWSMLDYYSGKNPKIRKKVERYAFIEDSPLPRHAKMLWAHHRYILALRK